MRTWPQNRYPLFSRTNFHHTRLILTTMLRCLPSCRSLLAALSCGLVFLTTVAAARQAPQPDSGKPKAKANGSTDNATKNAEDQPMWDPLRAEKDLEVGQYYMRKGDLDAAMDRFEDAILAKPGYAIPFRHLGEAQEKKGLKRDALKSYTRYLELLPHAEDRSRIEKRIEKLRVEVEKGKK